MLTRAALPPEVVRRMTLDDVDRIHRYWRRNPPLRDLVAAFMGFKPQSETEDNLGDLLTMFPNGRATGP